MSSKRLDNVLHESKRSLLKGHKDLDSMKISASNLFVYNLFYILSKSVGQLIQYILHLSNRFN